MTFRNSVRLLLTNFSLVWKILLYFGICFCVFVAIFIPILGPIVSKLTTAGVFEELNEIFNMIFTSPSDVITAVENVYIHFFAVLRDNASVLMVNYVFLGIVVFILIPFFFGLFELALNDCLYGFMTSQSQYGFTATFIKTFVKSMALQAVKLLIMVPINVLIIGILYGIIKLFALGGLVNIICAFIVFVMSLIVISMKITLFSCWTPSMVVNNTNPFIALGNGIKVACKNYWKNLSNVLVAVLIAFVINFFFGLFSLGAGLFLTVPITVVSFAIIGMIIYFNGRGMRYYVYVDTFVTTKKLEEQDKTQKLKNLL